MKEIIGKAKYSKNQTFLENLKLVTNLPSQSLSMNELKDADFFL